MAELTYQDDSDFQASGVFPENCPAHTDPLVEDVCKTALRALWIDAQRRKLPIAPSEGGVWQHTIGSAAESVALVHRGLNCPLPLSEVVVIIGVEEPDLPEVLAQTEKLIEQLDGQSTST